MDFIDNIIDKGKDIINNPDKIIEQGLNFVGQDVLDKLIDKAVLKINEAIKSSDLDPLPFDDITIPFNLDKLSGMCSNNSNPLVALLCACLSKTMNLEGDLFLKNGRLTGLSNLARSMPTLLKYEDGVVKVSTSLGVTNLESPFDTSTSVEVTEKFQPEVAALVDKIGFECGVEIPIKSGSSLDGTFNFDPPVDDLPVHVDVKLGELGDLEPLVKDYIIEPVKRKLGEKLKTEFKQVVQKILKEQIPGLSALT